jgi:hypothetical protein
MPLVSCVFVLNWCDVDISEGSEPPPQLVVFLHELEQFDEAIVQDLFYICRQARFPYITTSLKDVLVLTCHNFH